MKNEVEVVERDLNAEIETMKAQLAKLEEEKAAEEEAKKKAVALARKEEATVVNEAIDTYEEAKSVCNEAIRTAYEEYKCKVAEAEKALKAVEADAESKLNKFLETHDSFHYTYKSNDGKIVRNYNYRNNAYDVFDNFKEFERLVKNLWF